MDDTDPDVAGPVRWEPDSWFYARSQYSTEFAGLGPGVRCPVSGVQCSVFGVDHLASGLWPSTGGAFARIHVLEFKRKCYGARNFGGGTSVFSVRETRRPP